jgi:probable F420-dependent oxidoreductase
MRVGVIFPQTEFGSDPAAMHSYAQTAQALGFNHILIFDHVLGADSSNRPDWGNRYTHEHPFHEPFVTFGFFAAAAPGLELVTGVIILPQRQTALVAKQAAEVDILTGGNFRLGVGVGWNNVEYEALNEDFRNRGRRCDEQIALLRALWTNPLVNFKSNYHRVIDAGLNPMPIQQPIPVWIGGDTEVAAARAARLGDGWIPHGRPDDEFRRRVDQMRQFAAEAGRPADAIGVEARLNLSDVPERNWLDEVRRWQEIGVTHLALATTGAGLASADAHIDTMRRFAETIALANGAV